MPYNSSTLAYLHHKEIFNNYFWKLSVFVVFVGPSTYIWVRNCRTILPNTAYDPYAINVTSATNNELITIDTPVSLTGLSDPYMVVFLTSAYAYCQSNSRIRVSLAF
jgi:hypothetical protein